MTKCAVVSCKNTGIHVFPKDPKRRKLWEKALRIKNWKSSPSSKLCYEHFTSSDYKRINFYGAEPLQKKLKKDAVPSIFPFTKVKPPNLLAQQRSHRLEMRNIRKNNIEIFLPGVSNIMPQGEDQLNDEEMRNNETNNTDIYFHSVSSISPQRQVQFNDEELIIDSEIEIPFSSDLLSLESSQPSEKPKSISIQVDFQHVYGYIELYKNDNAAIAFYTGFETYDKFYFVFSTLSPMAHLIRYYGSKVENISKENQFFMTMMKLRRNTCNYELSLYFKTSQTTVYNIFITWINFMDQLWRKLNIWPEKDLVLYYMPNTFKQYDKSTRVIIDGTEIKIQKPQNPLSQQASWSSYKHSNTLKVLVGATPGGLLSYCSPAYGGSISDRQTVERSNLLIQCESGDTILADRGFNIQDLFIGKDIKLNIPSFLKGKSQIPGLTLLSDRKLASQRVHIERLIGLIKTYTILKEEMQHNYVPLASKIFFCCLMCCNFRENIMKK